MALVGYALVKAAASITRLDQVGDVGCGHDCALAEVEVDQIAGD
jgi:hypothetical protein